MDAQKNIAESRYFMTSRNFYEAIVNANINEEITAYASQQIQKMDERNEKRRTTPTKAQQANAEMADLLFELLDRETVYTAAQIAEMQGVTTQKATAILKTMAKNGNLTETEVKNGNRIVKGYQIKE